MTTLSETVPAGWMQMASGKGIDLANPRLEDIDFNDIATHLSRLTRFTGAATISVAQHSVLVSFLVPQHLRLYGLLHDAHEAYVGDQSTPLKNTLTAISPELGAVLSGLKEKWDVAIWQAAGIPAPDASARDAIKAADHLALSIERRDCMAPPADDTTSRAWAWLPTPPSNVRVGEVSAEHAREAFLRCLAGDIWSSDVVGWA